MVAISNHQNTMYQSVRHPGGVLMRIMSRDLKYPLTIPTPAPLPKPLKMTAAAIIYVAVASILLIALLGY
jgi:hypothetical protein